jgi:hypothetical protein
MAWPSTPPAIFVVMGRGNTQGGTIPPSLEEFTSAELSAQPTQGPNVTIGFTGFVRPAHAVFDIKGDLWVSDFLSNAVFEYTLAQLAVGGPIVIPNLIPNVELTSNPAFTGPIGIAFDAAGDLWIANTGTTTIFEFNAASLPTAAGSTVTLTPNVILSDDGNGSISCAVGVGLRHRLQSLVEQLRHAVHSGRVRQVGPRNQREPGPRRNDQSDSGARLPDPERPRRNRVRQPGRPCGRESFLRVWHFVVQQGSDWLQRCARS